MKTKPVSTLVLLIALLAIAVAKVTDRPEPSRIFPTDKTTPSPNTIPSAESPVQPRDFGIKAFSLLGLIALPIIAVVLLPLLLILFLPVPVITTPAGRASEIMLMDQGHMRSILESSTCVQRISCELMKSSSTSPKWIRRFVSSIPISFQFKQKVKKMSNGLQECQKLQCNPMRSVMAYFSSNKEDTGDNELAPSTTTNSYNS